MSGPHASRDTRPLTEVRSANLTPGAYEFERGQH
jgi:hypothetical protein